MTIFCNRPRPTVEAEARSTYRHCPFHRGSRSTGIDRRGAICVVLFFFFLQPWRSQQSARRSLASTSLDCCSMLRLPPSPETPQLGAVGVPCVTATTAAMSNYPSLTSISVIKPRPSHILVPHDHGHNFFFHQNNISSLTINIITMYFEYDQCR
jgi:hypothetical protein